MKQDIEPIRVVIVDGCPASQTGLSHWLSAQRELIVVGVLGTAAEAVRLVPQLQPDVVLMDLLLPDSSGSMACEQILAQSPDVAVLILSDSDRDVDLARTWAAGAVGFLLKRSPMEDLIGAIGAAVEGRLLFTQEQRRRIRAWEQLVGERLKALSPREVTVLRLLISGSRNHEIAETLALSLNTVEKHVSLVLGKLRVHSRLELLSLVHRTSLGDMLLSRHSPPSLDGGLPPSIDSSLPPPINGSLPLSLHDDLPLFRDGDRPWRQPN